MSRSDQYEVRAYRPSDCAAVIAVFLSAVRDVAARDYSAAQISAWAQADPQRWEERLNRRQAWVAVHEGNVIGFTELEADGHLDTMFVHADWQGGGVASALLHCAEEAARFHGSARLYTEASLTARPFFERRGFSVVNPQSVSVRGQTFINFRMEKIMR